MIINQMMIINQPVFWILLNAVWCLGLGVTLPKSPSLHCRCIFFPRTGAYPCSSMSIVVLSLKIIPMSTNRGQYDAVFCVLRWCNELCVCVSCVLCRVRLELKPDTLWGSTNGINDIHFSNFKKIAGIQQFNPNAQCLIVPWSLHLEVAYHSSKYCV